MAATCCNSRRQFKFSSFSLKLTKWIRWNWISRWKGSTRIRWKAVDVNEWVKPKKKNKRREETRVSRDGLVISCIRCTGMDHGRTNCSLTGQHRSTAHLSAMFTPMITWPVLSIFDDNSRSLIFLIFVILLTFSTKWNSWIESCIVTWPLNGQLSSLEGSLGAPT